MTRMTQMLFQFLYPCHPCNPWSSSWFPRTCAPHQRENHADTGTDPNTSSPARDRCISGNVSDQYGNAGAIPARPFSISEVGCPTQRRRARSACSPFENAGIQWCPSGRTLPRPHLPQYISDAFEEKREQLLFGCADPKSEWFIKDEPQRAEAAEGRVFSLSASNEERTLRRTEIPRIASENLFFEVGRRTPR